MDNVLISVNRDTDNTGVTPCCLPHSRKIDRQFYNPELNPNHKMTPTLLTPFYPNYHFLCSCPSTPTTIFYVVAVGLQVNQGTCTHFPMTLQKLCMCTCPGCYWFWNTTLFIVPSEFSEVMENKSICCKFKYQDWSTLSTVSVGWDINMLGDLDYHLGDLDDSLLIQLIVASGHAQLFDLQFVLCFMIVTWWILWQKLTIFMTTIWVVFKFWHLK